MMCATPESRSIRPPSGAICANRVVSKPVLGRAAGRWPARRLLSTDLSMQCSSRQVDVGQAERDERPRGVLGKASVAHLAEAPKALDDGKDMFDPGPHLRLCAVDQTLEFLRRTARSDSAIGAVGRCWGLRANQIQLRGVGAIAPDLLLAAMKQIGQWVLVVNVGRRDHRAVRQAGLAVHADVHLHAEVVLLALAR